MRVIQYQSGEAANLHSQPKLDAERKRSIIKSIIALAPPTSSCAAIYDACPYEVLGGWTQLGNSPGHWKTIAHHVSSDLLFKRLGGTGGWSNGTDNATVQFPGLVCSL